jgi:hypothetical protein
MEAQLDARAASSSVPVIPVDAAARGGLTPYQVRGVVVSHVAAIRYCYEREVPEAGDFSEGTLGVAWTIEPHGTVSQVSIVSTTLNMPRVEECVVRQVKYWRFPASNTPTVVASFPFKFGRARAAEQ